VRSGVPPRPQFTFTDSLKRESLGDRPPLPPIINVQEISKAFGANPLFQNVSFTVTEAIALDSSVRTVLVSPPCCEFWLATKIRTAGK